MMRKLIPVLALLLALEFLLPAAASADSSADFLFQGPDQFHEPDSSGGPWVYESESLTVCIKKTRAYNRDVCYIADIRLRNGERAYTGWANGAPCSGNERPHRIARRYQAVFGLMGDYVTHIHNSKGVMIRDGVVYYDKDAADTLAILPSGEMEVYPKGTITAQQLLALGVNDSLAFGPVLVLDSKLTPAVYTHRLRKKNYRAGIGKVEDGHYIAIVSQSNLTFEEYAQLFIDCGCRWAYNLDGGCSASMVLMGEQINLNKQRAVPDVLLIGTSGLVPGVNEDAVYKGSN